MEEAKRNVFISYSHKDRESCERIAGILDNMSDFAVWYDKGLIPGEVYRKRIVEVIRASEYFVVLLSSSSADSEWVLDEVEYAKKLHKKIVPVWLEDVIIPDDLDMILQRYHSLFWHLRSSDAQFEKSIMMLMDGNAADGAADDSIGFGNEFSEKVNMKMKELLEKERQGEFSECYKPENACLIGAAYLFGGWCAVNRKKARHYFRAAEYGGNPDGRFYQLEMMLEDKYEETWDEPDEEFCRPIVEEIEHIAQNGSVAAKLYLANLLWYGRCGCKADIAASAALYEECARKGNARAQYIMASNYYFGEGVAQDYDLAIMYANLAVEQKYIKAWRRWGKFYRDGLAVPQDHEKARASYEKGAQMGDLNCYNKIGDMLYYGWGFPVDRKAAFEYYLKAERAPRIGQKYCLCKAKEAIGRCYENGHGVEKDMAVAAEKYLEGYRYGSMECKEGYIRCSSILKKT